MAVIRYPVQDIDTALPFCAMLGFELEDRRGPPFAIVRRGDLTVWLSGPGSSAARPMPGGATAAPGGWNRLVIEVEDLDATLAALRAGGAKFRGDPVAGPGGRQVLVDDPSGNPVELFEHRRS